MVPNPAFGFALAAAAMSVCAGGLRAGEWHVDRAAANRAAFTARYLGTTFDGTTSQIDGFVYWKGNGPDGAPPLGGEVYVEVDLNALDTGIGLRNTHMRENYLETGRHPFASFKGGVSKWVPQAEGGALAAVEGVLSLHGREAPLNVAVRVAPQGDGFRTACSFPLDIRDFGIEVPSLMGATVDPNLLIELDLAWVKVR
jgi:polyisoprenoid-binding protein YceI